jgi:hypothetical protein
MKTLHFAIIAVFCCVIFLSSSDSYASTCAVKETIYSAPQFFLLSDNVFAGTVTSITDYGNHQWQVHFDIEKAWKGAATGQTSTVMTNTLQACGYSISVGEKYLIYTNGSPSFINPIYSKLYSDALDDIALFDDPKFQSQEQAKEDLNKKLEAAQDRVGSMMMDKSHIPVVTVGVDQVNSTLDITIDDEKATLSIEQYQQDLKEILGDIPIKVGFGHATALMPILRSVDDQGQTTSHPVIHGSNSSNVLQSPLQQFRSGIASNNVKCRDDLILITKASDDSPACVKSDTAQKLIARGWSTNVLQPNQLADLASDKGVTLHNQTSTQPASNKTPSIFPGDLLLSSCGGPAVQYHSSSDIINSTGFGVYRNGMNYSSYLDDYVIQPGYHGTITYVIDAGASPTSHMSFPVRKELNITNYAIFHHGITDYEELLHNPSVTISGGDYKSCFKRPDGTCAGQSGPITGKIDATVVDHPGVNVSFEPASEVLQYNDTKKDKSSQVITMSVSVDADSPQGTYWVILSPEECLGGEMFLFTVGSEPFHK